MGYYTSLLKDTAILKSVDGADEEGRPNIIELEEIDCKIEMKNAIVINNSGEEIASSGRLFTEHSIKTGDILEINNDAFTVLSVNPYFPIDSSLFVINEVNFG